MREECIHNSSPRFKIILDQFGGLEKKSTTMFNGGQQ
jgi:hypothetical protein